MDYHSGTGSITMRSSVRKASFGLLLILVASGFCQQNSPQKKETEETWNQQWRNKVVALGEVVPDKLMGRDYFHAIGTGMFVSTDKETGYLVTARHVFCDTEKGLHPHQLHLRFAWQDHKSVYEYLGVPFDARDKSGADLWSSLEDGSDVAAIRIPLNLFSLLPPEDQLGAYETIGINDIGVADIYEGEQVYVLGFPEIVPKEKLARAVWRQGIVAWVNPRQSAEKVFLVDANLGPGNSGGPVIQIPFGLKADSTFNYLAGGKFLLLGLVSQAPVEEVTTRIGKAEMHTDIIGVGAIGVIEPASKIHKLVIMMSQGTVKAPTCDVPEAKPSR